MYSTLKIFMKWEVPGKASAASKIFYYYYVPLTNLNSILTVTFQVSFNFL